MLNKNPSIVFIKPRLFSHEVIEEPLGILYVASYIRNKIKNIELKIIDGHLENSSSLDIFKKLQNTYIDFICISTTTSGSNEAYKLVNLLKNCNETKNIPIIWGGSHPTTLPEECLRQGGEFCVIGEGEVTTFELISHLIENKFVDNLPGIVYKNGLNNIIYNPPRKLISNLSDIPFPAFDLIDVSKYSTDIHLFPASNNRMALPIMASRGCPNDCAFCCSKSMWRRRTRFRTIENVVDEIIEMKNNYNVSQFHFYDDNFLLLPDFAKKFAEKIIATDIDIKFTCQSSCQSIIDIDDEILKVLKESGMSVLEFGIESLNREVLKMINKPDYINNVYSLTEKLQKHGIDPYPLIMYLAPGETLQNHLNQSKMFLELFNWSDYVKNTYNFREDIFLFNGGACTPFPGTLLFKHLEKYGVLLTHDWQKFNTENIVFIPFSLLLDIPCKNAYDISQKVKERITKLHDRALQFNPIRNIGEKIDELWKLIDGKKNIKNLSDELYLNCEQEDDMNSLMAFVCISVLVLLLNEQRVLPITQYDGE